MTTFWDAANGGTLTGTERFGADKAGSGDPADSVHYTADQLAAFGEAENAASPRPGDTATMEAIDDAQDAATAAAAAASAAAGAASTAQTTANTAVAAIGVTDPDIISPAVNTAINSATLNKTVIFAMTGTDAEAQFSNTCFQGQVVHLQRSFVTAPDPGGALILGSGGDHRFNGETTLRVTRAYAVVECRLVGIPGGIYLWAVTGDLDTSASDSPLVLADHTTSTLTLTKDHAGVILPLSAAANAIAVTIPHTLYTALGDDRGYRVRHRVASVAGGAVTFAGSGGIVLTYHGKDPGVTPFAAGDLIEILVTSATSADVITYPVGAGGGSGDVVGPASAVDDRIATFDGASGKLIQDSGVSMADLAKTATLTQYTSSGSYSIPAGALYLDIMCVGAGGGGGGGANATGAVGRSGGCGGGGGARSPITRVRVSDVTGPLTVTIGAAGTAGTAATGSSNADGGDGGAGGSAIVTDATTRVLCSAYGGGGGRRGTATLTDGGGGSGGGTASAGGVGLSVGTVAGGLPGASALSALSGTGAAAGIGAAGGLAEWGGGGGGGRSGAGFRYAGGGSLYGGGGGGNAGVTDATPTLFGGTPGGISGAYVSGTGGAAGTSSSSPTAGVAGTAGDGTRCGSGGGGGGSTVTSNTAGAAGGAGGAWGGAGGGGGCGTGSGAGAAGGVGGAGGVRIVAVF